MAYRLLVARCRVLITGQVQDVSFRAAGRRMALQHGARGRVRAHVLMPVAAFAFKHVLTRRTPMGRREMHEVRSPGGQPEPPLTVIVYGERTSRGGHLLVAEPECDDGNVDSGVPTGQGGMCRIQWMLICWVRTQGRRRPIRFHRWS